MLQAYSEVRCCCVSSCSMQTLTSNASFCLKFTISYKLDLQEHSRVTDSLAPAPANGLPPVLLIAAAPDLLLPPPPPPLPSKLPDWLERL
jgi:hypothetical protein